MQVLDCGVEVSLNYRVGHKSLDKNAFKSQIFLSSDLRPTAYFENFILISVFLSVMRSFHCG
jgi:hypothetical protein